MKCACNVFQKSNICEKFGKFAFMLFTDFVHSFDQVQKNVAKMGMYQNFTAQTSQSETDRIFVSK